MPSLKEFNPEKIPDDLKVCRQWVIWKSVVVDGKVTKPPHNPHTLYPASVTDPSHWGSFDDAVKAMQDNPSGVSGIGFVFTDEDEFFGIDIDDEAKVKPEHLEARRYFVGQLLANFDTYTEVSPSGKGLHIIGKGRLPFPGRKDSKIQVELYQQQRYFTITGEVFQERTAIKDQQAVLDGLADALLQPREGAVGKLQVSDTEVHRRLDLTDDEVIRLANNFHPAFAARFNCQTGCEPGEWSETFMMVVGVVERFTGLVEQVKRIVSNSPMVLDAPPSGVNERRIDKAKRNIDQVLALVRPTNSRLMAFAAHGRQQWENVQRAKIDRAQRIAEEISAKSEHAINEQHVVDAFPMLDRKYLELTRPPGNGGLFVEAAEKACHHPYTPFAIPATLAAIAGIVGRGYKLPDGKGLNLNFILAAPTGAGKTQVMDAWRRFVSEAAIVIENDSAGPSPQRIIQNGTISIQGIFEDFMQTPSLTWMIEECASQLRSMAKATTSVETQLRDSYNELYDCSSHDKLFSLPRSKATKRENLEPINNLSVSTFWTTATAKFDISNGDALDGFLSRVTIIRHSGHSGDRQRYPQAQLSEKLRESLVALLRNAKRLDEKYSFSPAEAEQLLTFVDASAIADLKWEILTITDRIREASIGGRLPESYVALSRLPITAERIAGLLAVLENPHSPSITIAQYLWSFGYLLQNAVGILADLGSGELGEKASDETLAVVRMLRRELTKSKRPPPGILRGHLRRRLVDVLPFSNAKAHSRQSSSKWATETIDHMLKEKMLIEVEDPRGGTSRLICPTDDPIWSE